MATEAMPDAVPPTDHYQLVCSQIPNLTTSQKLDAIEQLTRSIRSTATIAQPPETDWEEHEEATREVFAVAYRPTQSLPVHEEAGRPEDDEEERIRRQHQSMLRLIEELEVEHANLEVIRMTGRDHDKIIYGI